MHEEPKWWQYTWAWQMPGETERVAMIPTFKWWIFLTVCAAICFAASAASAAPTDAACEQTADMAMETCIKVAVIETGLDERSAPEICASVYMATQVACLKGDLHVEKTCENAISVNREIFRVACSRSEHPKECHAVWRDMLKLLRQLEICRGHSEA